MFDTLKEKSKTLSKVGSFYTSVITDKDINVAHRLSHIPYCTSLFQNFNNIYKSLTNDAYSNKKDLRIDYKDSDIKCGTYDSQNKNSDYLPELEDITILPQQFQQRLDKITLEDNFSLAFVLTVPSDIYVRIIQLHDGSILTEGLNFKSQFGSVIFTENPIALFKGMYLFALSYTQRNRNILCYPLQLQDVYGDISHIVDYYRNNQSLKQFKKALYQAIGIPVVLQDDVIKDKVNLTNGVSYTTFNGLHYDADFPHTHLNIGDIIRKDYIIGGEEFLKVYLPDDIIPESIEAVSIQNMSITGDKSLFVKNITSELYKDNLFQAKNFVYGDGKQYYIDYINNNPQEKPSRDIPDSMNCIDFLRDVVAANKCIIIQIDEEIIPYDIAMKLKSFVIDHSPIGSVIAYCNGEMPEPEPEPLPELIRLRTDIDISAPEDRLNTLDDGTTLISSLNLTSAKGFTLMLTMHWTSVTDAPLIWFAHNQVNHTVGNAMAVLGYTKGFKHNSMYNANRVNSDTTDLYTITDENKDNVPDYIDSISPRDNTSLAEKTLVYFVTIKNNEQTDHGQAILYELMNDKNVYAIAKCYNADDITLARGTLGWITCSNWEQGSANNGSVTVDAYDGILTTEEMTRLANNISQ